MSPVPGGPVSTPLGTGDQLCLEVSDLFVVGSWLCGVPPKAISNCREPGYGVSFKISVHVFLEEELHPGSLCFSLHLHRI